MRTAGCDGLLAGGGTLRVEKNCVQVELPKDIPDDKPDNRILKVCKGLSAVMICS